MGDVPVALGVALLISYAAMLLMISTTLAIKRLGLRTTRILLWTVIALGVLSLTLRTTYFLL